MSRIRHSVNYAYQPVLVKRSPASRQIPHLRTLRTREVLLRAGFLAVAFLIAIHLLSASILLNYWFYCWCHFKSALH